LANQIKRFQDAEPNHQIHWMPNHITRFSGCQTKSPDSVVAKPNQKIPKMPRQIIMFKRCPTKPPDSGVVDTGNDTGEQLSARNRRLIYCQ
jgi:hypothetical protein